jgi:hypothetical protein
VAVVSAAAAAVAAEYSLIEGEGALYHHGTLLSTTEYE